RAGRVSPRGPVRRAGMSWHAPLSTLADLVCGSVVETGSAGQFISHAVDLARRRDGQSPVAQGERAGSVGVESLLGARGALKRFEAEPEAARVRDARDPQLPGGRSGSLGLRRD